MNSSTEQNPACSDYRSAIDLLLRIPLFSVIPFEATKVLACLSQHVSFPAGETIFQQGEFDLHAYYILEGEAELLLHSDEGEQSIRIFGKGDFIGGLSLISAVRRLFSLKAKTDLCCILISAEGFQKTLRQFPEAAAEILKELSAEVYHWEYRLLHGKRKLCGRCRSGVGVTLI